jgi:hypothetical protein
MPLRIAKSVMTTGNTTGTTARIPSVIPVKSTPDKSSNGVVGVIVFSPFFSFFTFITAVCRFHGCLPLPRLFAVITVVLKLVRYAFSYKPRKNPLNSMYKPLATENAIIMKISFIIASRW